MEMNFREALDGAQTVSCTEEQVVVIIIIIIVDIIIIIVIIVSTVRCSYSQSIQGSIQSIHPVHI